MIKLLVFSNILEGFVFIMSLIILYEVLKRKIYVDVVQLLSSIRSQYISRAASGISKALCVSKELSCIITQVPLIKERRLSSFLLKCVRVSWLFSYGLCLIMFVYA